MKKILCLLLGAVLVFSLALPVSAAEGNVGGWIQLLEYSSVGGTGENWFMVNAGSGSFTIPMLTEKRLVKVDITIWHQTAARISSASVTQGGTTNNLTVLHVGSGISRIYGAIPNAYYESLTVNVKSSTTSSMAWEVLSCRATPLAATEYAADATIWIDGDMNNTMKAPGKYEVAGIDGHEIYTVHHQVPILVNDWMKYDSVTFYGSLEGAGLNSVRCSIGNMGLPYEISYTSTNTTGSEGEEWVWNDIKHYTYDDSYQGTGEVEIMTGATYHGKVLYTITVDLSDIDRTLGQPLVCFFTMVVNDGYGYSFNVQGVSGALITADTTQVSIWNRFTAFMTDLFGGDASQADEFAENMQQTGDQLADANDQIDSMTKPAVEDVPLDPSQYLDSEGIMQTGQLFQELLGNDLVMPMVSITLICGLASFILF